MARLNGIMIKISCGDKPVSVYTVDAGDLSVRIPVCGYGLPEDRGAFTQIVKILDSSTRPVS
jgi:hypothetical protein